MPKYLKYAVTASIFVIAVFLLLKFSGNFLVAEVIKEVAIEKREEVLDAKIGKPAPYFELFDLNGVKVKSTDFLGKPLAIIFWTSWNAESADQIKILDDYLLESPIAKSGVVHFLTINSQEDKSAVLSFITRGNYKVRALLDESGEITEKYDARSLPASYFIDKEGVLKEVFIGVLGEKILVEKIEKLLAQ